MPTSSLNIAAVAPSKEKMMTRKNPTNTMTHYRQHPKELESGCRSLNAFQLVSLLVAAIGSGLYLSVKCAHLWVNYKPLAEWLAKFASHPIMDVSLIVIIFALYFSARAYSDASRFLLVRSILEEEGSAS